MRLCVFWNNKRFTNWIASQRGRLHVARYSSPTRIKCSTVHEQRDNFLTNLLQNRLLLQMQSDTKVFILSRSARRLIQIVNQAQRQKEGRQTMCKKRSVVIPRFLPNKHLGGQCSVTADHYRGGRQKKKDVHSQRWRDTAPARSAPALLTELLRCSYLSDKRSKKEGSTKLSAGSLLPPSHSNHSFFCLSRYPSLSFVTSTVREAENQP